ncbi:MAG TPA: hypothetical protein VFQ63_02635 [Patescibacteria group bacterium]|nr:hypothetical protein [Patescibacteria group bacterium]
MAKQSTMQDYMGKMEDWFMKLPALPKNAQDVLVRITPWIALIFGILGILGSLAGLGVLTALSPFVLMGNGIGGTATSLLTAVLALVSSALLLAAFPGTKAMKMKGWTMLFWSEVVGLLSSVILVSLTGVIGAFIGFYLLYQIKRYYK